MLNIETQQAGHKPNPTTTEITSEAYIELTSANTNTWLKAHHVNVIFLVWLERKMRGIENIIILNDIYQLLLFISF